MPKEIKLYVFEIDGDKSQSKAEANLTDFVNAGWQIVSSSGAGLGHIQGSSKNARQKVLQHIVILEREVPAEE